LEAHEIRPHNITRRIPRRLRMSALRRTAWPFAVLGVAVVLAGLIAFVFWRIETWPARTADDISQAFQDAFDFDPTISVEETVIIEQSTDIAELAVLESTVVVEQGYENRWLLSTKRVRARGTYSVKTGFDLSKGVDVEVDKAAEVVRVSFPAPELLSVEQENLEITEWDNGLWNRLGEADAEEVVRSMNASARTRAEVNGVLESARTSVTEQLTASLAEYTGLAVDVEFR
jgi:hypothetical protein